MHTQQPISITTKGVHSSVVVDGQEIAQGLRGIRLNVETGCLPELELDLFVLEQVVAEAEQARVVVPEATAAALRSLGWTPPADWKD